jgi:phosphotransferase system enzyme I (PtsI)
VSSAQIDTEIQRLAQAVADAKRHVREVSARLPPGPLETNAILDAYLTMIGDPMLIERVEKKIRDEKKCAEWAVAQACDEIAKLFLPAEPGERDAYIAERRHDIEFVCDRLLRELTGDTKLIVPRLDQPMVVIARDLSPADTAAMVREPVIAFITEIGTRTSHTAIMARALEIPAVVGAADALSTIRTGDTVIVDGLRGQVVVNPNEMTIAEARGRGARHLAFARGLLSARNQPCVTRDGEAVSLKANVELPAEAILALDHGAEGIGLYRTEFIYIDRTTMPTEDEQYELYRAVVEAVAPRPVTLRTFDIGGDKFASSFQLPAEMNPASLPIPRWPWRRSAGIHVRLCSVPRLQRARSIQLARGPLRRHPPRRGSVRPAEHVGGALPHRCVPRFGSRPQPQCESDGAGRAPARR